MRAALDNGRGADQRELRLVLELGDGERTAVAHGALQLQQRDGHVVLKAARIGNVGVHAFLEGQRLLAAQVVTAPVARTRAALAPILLHVRAVDHNLRRGAFLETCEVAAQHDEVGAHGKRQRDMVVVYDAAVGADRHVNAGLLEILIARLSHLDDRRSLAAADTLGLTGNADGAAADAHLDEVSARIGQEAEALAVNHVARTNLHAGAVMLAHPVNGDLLPIGEALGGVDAQHVSAGLHERRHALGEVAGVDARAHHVALMLVQHLVGIFLVRVIVLAEYQRHQAIIGIDDGQRVQLVVPDDVVGRLERGVRRSHDHLLTRRHDVGHLGVKAHAGQAIIAPGHHAQQLAVGAAVSRNGHGGVAVALLELHHISQRHVRGKVSVRGDEARLVALHAGDHGRFVLDALVAVDEGKAALGGKGHGHAVIGDRRHNGRHHGDTQLHGTLFLALAIADERRLQVDRRGHAACRGVARNQQVLVESAGRLLEVVCHGVFSFFLRIRKTPRPNDEAPQWLTAL